MNSTALTPISPPPPVHVTRISGKAVICLGFGLLGWVGLVLVGPLVSIFAGHVAIGEISRSHGRITGGRFATIGLIFAYTQLFLEILSLVFLVILPMIKQ